MNLKNAIDKGLQLRKEELVARQEKEKKEAEDALIAHRNWVIEIDKRLRENDNLMLRIAEAVSKGANSMTLDGPGPALALAESVNKFKGLSARVKTIDMSDPDWGAVFIDCVEVTWDVNLSE